MIPFGRPAQGATKKRTTPPVTTAAATPAVAVGLPYPDPARSAFFLDFDGTLAPIVARPELAGMADGTRAAVAALSARADGALAIVSGRALADLDRMLSVADMPAAGSHGLEFRLANGAVERPDIGPEAGAAIDRFVAFAERHGLLAERKPAGATVHFRAAPEMAEACLAALEAEAASAPELRAVRGHMVAELAVARVDKGSALRRFMEAPPFAGRVPVAAGDDATDEDAFAAAIALGGMAIKIGAGATVATHRAEDIDAFLAWLRAMAVR